MKMGIHGFKVTNSEEIRKQILAQLDEMEELARDLQQGMVNFFSIVFAYYRVDQYLRAKELREGQIKLDV